MLAQERRLDQNYTQNPTPHSPTIIKCCQAGVVLPQSFILLMRIKLTPRQRPAGDISGLWKDSPCSLNFVTPNTSHDRTHRFQFGSIYHRDIVDKPKKVFNQFEKPDMLRTEFRRQIEEASHHKYYSASKQNNQRDLKARNRAESMRNSVGSKLYSVPTKADYTYDRGGFRSHAFGDYNVKEIQTRVLEAKNNFSSGRRLDLSRPLNFYPGPGAYNPDPRLVKKNTIDAPLTMRTCISFRKQHSSKQKNQVERLDAQSKEDSTH